MKAGNWLLMVLVVAAVCAALFYGGFKVAPPAGGQAGTAAGPAPAGPLITVSPPAVRTFTGRVPWIGTVETQASVQLIAQVAGRVDAIAASDNAPIERGAAVMQLGGPRVESKQARLKVDVESLKSQLDLIDRSVQRLQQGVAAQLATKDQLATAKQEQVKLQGDLRNAGAALEEFERQVRVTAPMAGIFSNRRASVGQAVSAGEVLGEIIDAGHLRIAASLFPPTSAGLEGKEAIVRLDGGATVSGLIRRVLPEASDTGAVRVWIEGQQIDRRLRPGQTVSGAVALEVRTAALAVPESAIVYGSREQPYVFVRTDEAYERRSVELGLTEAGWVEVLSGLDKSEAVVTQGAYELFYKDFSQQFKVED